MTGPIVLVSHLCFAQRQVNNRDAYPASCITGLPYRYREWGASKALTIAFFSLQQLLPSWACLRYAEVEESGATFLDMQSHGECATALLR